MPLFPPANLPSRECRLLAAFAVALAAGGSLARGGAAGADAQAAGKQAAQSLHARVDALIEARPTVPLAPLVTDGEFIRRACLDLNGVIPTANEARSFIDDTSPEKRAALVDRLLASPQYARRMANFFDVTWMERRPDKNVPAAEWQEYLRASFAQNKPYDQLVREILSADGADARLRPAAKFYLDRDGEPSALTRDVGRMFLGRDMQCAQCHDHPLVATYFQDDYYGVYAFLVRGTLFTGKDKKVVYAETADGETSYKSVFTGNARARIPPRLPGDTEIVEPRFEPGQEYAVAPAKSVRPVPKFSRRAELAKAATSGHNAAFNRNIVNLLWALLMGRGLVEPVDWHHVDNPPTHPEVLDLLAAEFVGMKFDVKALLRELALTRTYQRSSEARSIEPPPLDAVPAQVASLKAEAARLKAQAEQSVAAAEKPQDDLSAAIEAADTAAAAVDGTRKAAAAAQTAADAASTALAKSRAESAGRREIARVLVEAAEKSQAAAQKLPEDKALVAAVDTIRARSAEFSAGLATLSKTIAQQETAAKTAADALAAARARAAQASAELTAARRHVADVRPLATSAEAKLAADKAAAAAAVRRTADITLLGELAQVRLDAAAAETAAVKALADRAAAQTLVQQAETQLTQAQQVAAEELKASDAAAMALSAARNEIEPKRESSHLVADAAAKAQQAADQVADDSLLQAVTQLKTKSDQLATELASLDRDVGQRSETARQSAERATAARAAADKAAADLAASRRRAEGLDQLAKRTQQQAAELRSAASDKLAAVADRGSAVFAIGSLKPLSPEQLAWSLMQATGVVDAQRAAAAAELAKQKQSDTALPPAKQRIEREALLEKTVYDKLAGNVATFVSVFGQPAASLRDFQATVQQALFLTNGGTVNAWIAPRAGNLADRLLKVSDTAALADELYLSVLSRRADDAERTLVTEYLSAPGVDRKAAVQELIWSLVSSNEFRFNH
jgi:Protein of unknown function (DUF1549)/Protein of unknown function (DUF1553)